MTPFLRRHWPLWVALAFLASTSVLTVRACLAATGGHFVYALDDPYITMAMARTLVRHGTWGVTPAHFSSSCSSPLWLLCVAATYAVFGVNDLSPLVLNFLAGAALLIVSCATLRQVRVAPTATAIGLAGVVFIVPVVPMAVTGLEHLLHAALSVAFLGSAARALSASSPRATRWRLAVLALLAVACRYESLFLVLPAVLLFAQRRQFRQAALLAVFAAVPVVAYGLFSRAHGWTFLPTPVLLKGQRPGAGWPGIAPLLGLNALSALATAPHLVAPIVAGAVILMAGRRLREPLDAPRLMIAMALVATLLHADLARIGSFFRYDAYLAAVWLVALGAATPLCWRLLERPARAGAALVGALSIAAIVALALVNRAQAVWWRTTSASREIFQQQYQMGLFLHRFFENRRVAANDIGAINYQAAIESFDLVGLANIDVARARLEGHYDTAAVDRLTRAAHVELALVYKPWFDGIGGLPPTWIEVGAWTSAERVVTGGATVSFYAVDPHATGALTQSLRLFSGQLPAGVVQSGAYLTASQAR